MGGGYGHGYGCYTFTNSGFPECRRRDYVLGNSLGRFETRLGAQPLSRVELRGQGGCCQGPLNAPIRYSPVTGYYQPGTSRQSTLGFGDMPLRYQSSNAGLF